MSDESVILKPPVFTKKSSEKPATPKKKAGLRSDTDISSPSKIARQEITSAGLVPPIMSDESVIFAPPVITQKTQEKPATPQKIAGLLSDTNISSSSKIKRTETTKATLLPQIMRDVIDIKAVPIGSSLNFVCPFTNIKYHSPAVLDVATFFEHHQSKEGDKKANLEDTDDVPKVSHVFVIHKLK